MDPRLSHVIATVYGKPWFIVPEQLAAIAEIVRFHASGGRLTDPEMRERLAAAAAANGPRRGARTSGAVAVIPMYGPIVPRANLMTEYSGGATISGMRAAFREALADESVGSILFDVDSPGGYATGVEEFASEIRASRGQKPIVAIANYHMASAAYYLSSQADEVVASPSSEVGWIGAATIHQEASRALDAEGITTTIFRNPAGKFGGNPYEPISDKASQEYQAVIDELSAQFQAAVAKGRGVSVATVKADYGQGGGMSASRAKAAGLVDRIETFDDTVRRLAAGKVTMRPQSTQARAVRIEHFNGAGAPIGALEALSMQEGGTEPADDPDAPASGEAGTPPSPDQTTEAEAALALARARAER
ncbi:MAG: S49 family peptidase [Chloroflexota bacterium]